MNDIVIQNTSTTASKLNCTSTTACTQKTKQNTPLSVCVILSSVCQCEMIQKRRIKRKQDNWSAQCGNKISNAIFNC